MKYRGTGGRWATIGLLLVLAGCFGGGGDDGGGGSTTGPTSSNLVVVESARLSQGDFVPGACAVRARVRNLDSRAHTVVLEYTAVDGSGNSIASAFPTVVLPARGVAETSAQSSTFVTPAGGTIPCSRVVRFNFVRIVSVV